MSFAHPQLPLALERQFPRTPGITCKQLDRASTDMTLVEWPAALGAFPSDAQLQTWVTNYQTYAVSNQSKDDNLQDFLDSTGGRVAKAIVNVLISKGVCTLAEIRAAYRALA